MIRVFKTYMRQFFTMLLLSFCFSQSSLASARNFFALLTLDDAARMVIQQSDNKVLATKTEIIKGKQIHIIKVLTPEGRIQHIKIDAESGRVIK